MSASPFIQEEEYAGGRFDWSLWRRILGHARSHRRWFWTMICSGLVLAGTETLLPISNAWLIDEAVAGRTGAAFMWYAILYVALVTAFSIIVWIFIRAAGHLSTGVAYDLREQGFARLQTLPFSYYDTRPTGWLVSRLTSDCTKISGLLPWFLLDLAWGSSFLTGIAVAMFILDWQLALWVLVIVPPLALVSWYFQRKLLRSSRLVRRTNSIITGVYNEGLMGVRTTRTLAREDESLAEFQEQSGDLKRFTIRNSLQSAVYLPCIISLGAVGVGMAIWKGGVQIQAGSDLSLGDLIAFMQFAVLFSMPIQEIAARITDLQAAQAAAERIQTLIETVPEIRDSPEVAEAMRSAPPGGPEDGGRSDITTIEFKHVDFWYKPDEPVLLDFNLRVADGQTVALVGATGGGKSTIASLAARFYEPRRGEILIDGVEYRQRSLHWYQSQLGVVLQTPHLFSGTIRENIRYGRLDASQAEVEQAARLVNAHNFIESHDGGYDAEVGEGGSKLSVGQRQLIALARAVLADPQIFIMDEATSSVDTETEQLIQSAIDTVLAGRIAFVIAHRLSTIRAADVILVIDHGRIVEQGTHRELLAAKGRYWRLYTRQEAEEEEAAMGRDGRAD
ncbi:MAG: ABC transporter ATP-binding protein [Phycisphaerales bacterium]|nr:ABC transporter ATP-binding protein [Phycisphaerales bacterium]